MNEQTGHFSGYNGLQLFYKVWTPDDPPKAVLVILHGAGEHIGRYKNLVDALVPVGFLLAGFDQRGHGQSPGQRNHIISWDEYRQDIQTFINLARKLAPGLPLFVYGHSQGSLELLDYILHDPSGLAGVISSGTALTPKNAAPPHLVLIAKILSRLKPDFALTVPLPGSALSRDPQVAQAYDNDPLVHRERSARWGTETLNVIEWIKPRASEIKLPVLFLHGECDQLLTVKGAQHFFDGITYPDKTMHIYPGSLHEPHNDIEHQQVTDDIRAWLEAHL